MKKRYALISVFDKTGIVDFAKTLSLLNFQILSTGGTAKILIQNGLKVIPVEKITKNPESFDGRMKTISFQIEGGILFDRNSPSHRKQAKDLNIPQVDIVVCNFYPFEKKQSIENIDVGGPTMVRAAAKNFQHVLVVIDPSDYQRVAKALNSGRENNLRKELAAKAFWHLTYYDSQIAHFLNQEIFPELITIPGKKMLGLRYGENPHQKSAVYKQNSLFFDNLQKHHGRDLSLINLTDINAGLEAVKLFSQPCAAVIKHNTPCGMALGKDIGQALRRAIAADPESAFGGVIVVNKNPGLSAVKAVDDFKKTRKSSIDIIASPNISKSTVEYLKKIRKNMGIYTFGKVPKKGGLNMKWINGGFILQTADLGIAKSFSNWQCVTKIKPTLYQLKQMKIGWKFVSRIRSNTIIVVDKKLPMTRGIGAGQTSRVRAAKIALEQAGKYAQGAIVVSDSFFPFDDSVRLAAKSGIAAIVQQGGSINDQFVIKAADELGISMIFTGRRAFWH